MNYITMHDLLSLAQGPAITRPIPRLKRKGEKLKNEVYFIVIKLF